ncbi:MAG: efflux RND transporter permease subunit [Gemmataceae bacterium]|nr:efflux RND transporter permease subunit [Gemmataceae bacterium]
MNPILFAMKRPVTILVMTAGLILAGIFSLSRIKIDIFPALNLPVIYVCQPYGGMDPSQMEGLIANYYEYHFLYIGGIHHVESKNVQGVSLMKLYFHPGTDMAQALAETVGYVNRSRAFMPPNTVPPFIMRFDTGSVPVGYLVLSSETKTIGQIQDQALFRVRPMFASIPGVSAPPPFGGNQRTIVVRVIPEKLRSLRLSPEDVVQALAQGNSISPSGAIRVGEKMPFVPINSMVTLPGELGGIPLDRQRRIFMRDVVSSIDDASDFPTGYALVNGRRAVYILATKRAEASSLAVVNAIRANLPRMQAALPDDIRVRFEFDQSPLVASALEGVAFEGLLGAGLTGLMVLLFLRDWRSALVVVVNIPIALIAAAAGLYLCGHTLNLMTLGGLALAVGILVDESTVEVENIHTQMPLHSNMASAVLAGNQQTAVPRFLAMLCVLAAFLSALFLQGAAQALFLPMALAVAFSMIFSYLLSSTLVPVLSAWLLAGRKETTHQAPGWYQGLLSRALATRWVLVPGSLAAVSFLAWEASRKTGTDLFPEVDNHQLQFRLRAPAGTRIEETEAITQEALRWLGKTAGEENVPLSLGYVGLVPSSYPINSVYQWMGGPEEAVMRVALKPEVSTRELRMRIRQDLPPHLRQWTLERWKKLGYVKEESAAPTLTLFFEPADVVNEVMSFGSATPIEVMVSGPKMPDNRAYAARLYKQMQKQSELKDLHFGQTLDYPSIEVKVDREKAAFSGVHADEVARALVAATSSSRFTMPNYWRDGASGIGYQVQVEVPQAIMNSPEQIEFLPVKQAGPEQRLLRDVATVKEGQMPGEVDRYNMRRFVSLRANLEGTDLGSATRLVRQAIADTGEVPQGVQVDVRGQIAIHQELFSGLNFGLALSVGAVFLLLLAYFQSLRLALIPLLGIPFVLCGSLLALLASGTTWNLQSFMGTIMAVGVASANAILLVSFAKKAMEEGAASGLQAAQLAASGRFRAIVMTALAMIAGMLPMALGKTSAGEQAAALARPVIGGILFGLIATLVVLPALFALLFPKPASFAVSLAPEDATSTPGGES